jgi:flagellar biosynthesis protein FlhA
MAMTFALGFDSVKGGLKRAGIGSDVGLAIAVVTLLSVIILPLPSFILDIGLSISVTMSILILMVAMFLVNPLDFTSFPTLLLLTTLLRLSLNVATTRLILSHGNEGAGAAGHVVAAFGGFLMGGDVLIGLILFSILLVVNFMVITKGSGRIAEVAARFSLDSLPGKQMAIDADISSGQIDEASARQRRRDLEAESGFYGAMDGAAKFVRGDAIAGLIITCVNIFGGLAIGIGRHGLSFNDAANTYTTLTVGDGLVSQIPALLVSAAAGIVVTKGSVEGSTDVALIAQLGRNPKPLALAAVAAAILALMPGLPALPFLALAGLAAGGAWLRFQAPVGQPEAPTAPVAAPSDFSVKDALRIDAIRLELGYGLLVLADGDAPRMTEQVRQIRRSLALELGVVIPPVRIQDNIQLAPDAYCVQIKEIEAGRGELRLGRLLVMDPKGGVPNLAGEATHEPAFGLPALWVDSELRENAVVNGYTVVDPASVLATHLAEIIRQNLNDLLSFSETQKLLDDLSHDQQKLISELIPQHMTVGGVQRVLQLLLAERVSIRDLTTILEGIHEACSAQIRSISAIASHVRGRLARQICDALMGPNGYIPLVMLSPEWDSAIEGALIGMGDERQLAMPPSQLTEFIQRLKTVLDAAAAAGESPALITGSAIRCHIRSVVERVHPTLPVIGQNEISPRVKIKVVGTL